VQVALASALEVDHRIAMPQRRADLVERDIAVLRALDIARGRAIGAIGQRFTRTIPTTFSSSPSPLAWS
jgi:hypothetical protein